MKRAGLRVTLALMASLLVVRCHLELMNHPVGNRIEYLLLDFWFSLRGPVSANPDVVVVSMDEESYRALGVPSNRAWPRALHAALLEKLRAAGARRVVFDVLFVDPSDNADTDALLERAFASIPSVIGAESEVKHTRYGRQAATTLPYAPFRKVAQPAYVGFPEEYGYVRRFNVPGADADIPNLLPLAFAAAGLPAGAPVPGTEDLINFYGPAARVTTYSYYQVLEKSPPFPNARLRDKIVFVGLELRSGLGPEQKDSFLTSYDEEGRTFGVEIHATAAGNLLDGNWIRRIARSSEKWLLSALLLAVCLSCLLLSPFRSAYVIVLGAGAWFVFSFLSFQGGYFFPGVTVFLVFAPAIYVGTTLISYLVARHGQRKLRKAFELYLSPHMAKQVTRDPSVLGLGGKKVIGTALFTDIADFTAITESMEAEEATHMLNDYFSEMVDAIFDSQGTLIKFIGDAVFALWGAPVPIDDQQDAAVLAALAIQKRLRSSKVLLKYPPLHTRIGVHCGPMMVGNLGSRRRFDFTAIGDAVNLASRVEGLNKYLGTTLLVTGSVVEKLKLQYSLVRMGKARVVGKALPVTLYTIVDDLPAADFERWQGALDLFEQRQWNEADDAFQRCRATAVFSTAAAFYSEQIQEHRVQGPGTEWQGELIMSAK